MMVCIQTLRQDVARLEFELLRACPGVTGYSHFQMSRNGLDMLANYSLGFEVDVRVIYITPTVNTVILTLRDLGSWWLQDRADSGLGQSFSLVLGNLLKYMHDYYCNRY